MIGLRCDGKHDTAYLAEILACDKIHGFMPTPRAHRLEGRYHSQAQIQVWLALEVKLTEREADHKIETSLYSIWVQCRSL